MMESRLSRLWRPRRQQSTEIITKVNSESIADNNSRESLVGFNIVIDRNNQERGEISPLVQQDALGYFPVEHNTNMDDRERVQCDSYRAFAEPELKSRLHAIIALKNLVDSQRNAMREMRAKHQKDRMTRRFAGDSDNQKGVYTFDCSLPRKRLVTFGPNFDRTDKEVVTVMSDEDGESITVQELSDMNDGIRNTVKEIQKQAETVEVSIALDQVHTAKCELESVTKQLKSRSMEVEDVRSQLIKQEKQLGLVELERDLFKAEAETTKDHLKSCIAHMKHNDTIPSTHLSNAPTISNSETSSSTEGGVSAAPITSQDRRVRDSRQPINVRPKNRRGIMSNFQRPKGLTIPQTQTYSSLEDERSPAPVSPEEQYRDMCRAPRYRTTASTQLSKAPAIPRNRISHSAVIDKSSAQVSPETQPRLGIEKRVSSRHKHRRGMLPSTLQDKVPLIQRNKKSSSANPEVPNQRSTGKRINHQINGKNRRDHPYFSSENIPSEPANKVSPCKHITRESNIDLKASERRQSQVLQVSESTDKKKFGRFRPSKIMRDENGGQRSGNQKKGAILRKLPLFRMKTFEKKQQATYARTQDELEQLNRKLSKSETTAGELRQRFQVTNQYYGNVVHSLQQQVVELQIKDEQNNQQLPPMMHPNHSNLQHNDENPFDECNQELQPTMDPNNSNLRHDVKLSKPKKIDMSFGRSDENPFDENPLWPISKDITQPQLEEKSVTKDEYFRTHETAFDAIDSPPRFC